MLATSWVLINRQPPVMASAAEITDPKERSSPVSPTGTGAVSSLGAEHINAYPSEANHLEHQSSEAA
jgi:hypothetical protein